ncbi:hypothetical protein CR513_24687, partial [Mucuna pruriens]
MEWNQECQEAFKKVKQYLESPPVLVPVVPGKPLILYLTVLKESMGASWDSKMILGKNKPSITSTRSSQNTNRAAYHPLDEYHPLSHKFLDEHIMMVEKDEQEDELDEWKLWFDGASNLLGNGIGVVLASLKGQYFPFSSRLGFDCTNNMVEYEACTMGIIMAIAHQIRKLKVFGDSALVIYQLREEWET